MAAAAAAAAEMSSLQVTDRIENSKFSSRVLIRSIVNRSDGGESLAGERMKIGGWVKTGREQGKGSFAFLEVNDGSCPTSLQVIVNSSVTCLSTLVQTGTCVYVEGVLTKTPQGTKQKVELKVDNLLHVGPVDSATYPIPKTKLTLERLRDFVHMRPRTNTISAVARIRNALAYATHTFFQMHNFLYVHTPIITTSDCEGAGEMFQVTALFSDADKVDKELKQKPPPSEADIEAAKKLVSEKGEAVKSAKAKKEDITDLVTELKKAKDDLTRLEERFKLKPGLPEKDGKIDYTRDFFARQAFLTVSGQLQVETFACALSNVYTFGPTFRAEHSHTSRHLAEFWMVEPEIAFADLELAAKEGPYETYQGCPVSKGILQPDMWGVVPSDRWDWSALKSLINKNGGRNSLLVAPMPTASTSQILGNNECFEPYTSNIYSRRVLSGEFVVVNKDLHDLVEMGLWSPALKNKINL